MVPIVSLTTFVDFVIASGTPRLTVVRNARRLYAANYQPPFDYYKQLREAIIAAHSDQNPVATLQRFLDQLDNDKKREKYRSCVNAHAKWIGKKTLTWIGCSMRKWSSGGLTVKVNPELGLCINGVDHVIKLYFKQDPLSKLRVDTILHLLGTTLPAKQAKALPGILDVPNGKLITPTITHEGIGALLKGEAAAFTNMWEDL
jgi:hypothetical protein